MPLFVLPVKVKLNLKRALFLAIFLLVVFLCHSFLAIINPVVIKNDGISFGIKINLFWNLLFFLSFFFLIFFSKSKGLWLLLLGGGSNLLDRLFFGYVRDYWLLPVLNIFNNLNDWLITIGVIMFIIGIWKKK